MARTTKPMTPKEEANAVKLIRLVAEGEITLPIVSQRTGFSVSHLLKVKKKYGIEFQDLASKRALSHRRWPKERQAVKP